MLEDKHYSKFGDVITCIREMIKTHNLCCKRINIKKYGLHKCSSCFTWLSCLNIGKVGKEERSSSYMTSRIKAMRWIVFGD